MAGNREGGLKAAAKNKARDPDFYAKIGRKGGKISKRGKAKVNLGDSQEL